MLVISKLLAHLRQQWMGALALILVLAGGTAYATHPGGANTIDTGDIINGQVKTADLANNQVNSADVRDDTLFGGGLTAADLRRGAVESEELTTNAIAADGTGDNGSSKLATGSVDFEELQADSVRSTTVQDDTLTGGDLASGSVVGGSAGDVADGTIDANDIQDTTRSVQLPLSAFLNCSSSGPIDFNAGADTAPDFFSVAGGGGPLLLYWDADDVQRACTSLVVPQDYASGGQLVLITWPESVSQDNDWTGFTSRQALGAPRDLTTAATSGGTDCDAGIPRREIYHCVLTITGPIAAGDGLTVHVARGGGSDPFMYLAAVEFRYTAGQ